MINGNESFVTQDSNLAPIQQNKTDAADAPSFHAPSSNMFKYI